MVSVDKTHTEFILKDIFLSLSAQLKNVLPDSIECAFAYWIYPNKSSLINPVLPEDFSVANYTHVAQLGYLVTINPNQFSKYSDLLGDGLTRTAGRPANTAGMGRASFCNDAVALLGLALGANYLGAEANKLINGWLQSFIDPISTNLPEWKKMLMQGAIWSTDHSSVFSIDYSTKGQDFQLALLSHGINCFSQVNFDDAYRSICNGSIQQENEAPLIAGRLQAIDYIANHLPAISLSQPTVEQLVNVLNSLTTAFRRWIWEEKPKTSTGTAQKWDLQNEYHIQSLLYFVLAPLFPDIESEFYLENTGQLNARADIGLPSLNLIIEVKFLRKSKNFQDMIEEVAADSSLYFKKDSVYKKKYKQMLVFLWDHSKRDHEHGTFKNGVNGLNNVVGAVVISRPGIMQNE